eukprot:2859537-Rhodomonas_salina.1
MSASEPARSASKTAERAAIRNHANPDAKLEGYRQGKFRGWNVFMTLESYVKSYDSLSSPTAFGSSPSPRRPFQSAQNQPSCPWAGPLRQHPWSGTPNGTCARSWQTECPPESMAGGSSSRHRRLRARRGRER